jgi:hypothetical protein
MRRLIPMLISLTLLASACSSPGTTSTTTEPEGSTTGATPSTTPGVGTTEALTTTSAAVTTTVPGAFAVDATDYCVRGTASSDALNVRSGPGVEYQVLGDLAWNASGIRATGQGAPDSKGRTWLGVEYSGGIGWSAGWYLVPGPCTAANDDPAPLSDPALPAALSGGLVPWPLVDDQWVLALSASDAGATALYLMDPFGDTYEVFSWPGPSVRPFDLFDWRPDSRAALLQVGFDASGDKEILLIDLEKRTSETVLTTPELGFGGPATFTRPTGKDIVVAAGDDLTEHIEVRRSDGSIFSVLFDGPRPAGPPVPVAWIYGLEGTTAVVGDASGLHLVSNKGEPIRDLASPGASCRPIRWWDQDTVLARCVPPEVLAYLPDAYYNRLWLVPSDGSDATPLTAVPAEPVPIVDFGFADAWRQGGKVYAQWMGDCSAADIRLVEADGSTLAVTGQQLVGLQGGNLVVRRWSDCSQWEAGLYLVRPDGSPVADLMIAPAGNPGVIDVLMMRDLG